MYLRTPKKYTSRGKKRNVISLRWAWLWLITPVIAAAGIFVYSNIDEYAPPIQQWMVDRVNDAQSGLSTAAAPTALPTGDPTERRTQADEAWRIGALEQAVNFYIDILPAVPNDVLVYYRVTLGLLVQGDYAEALVYAERTVNANPYASDAWAIRAMAYDWNAQYGEAIASALHALDLNADNPRAMAFLAEAYYDIEQCDRSLTTVDRALEIDPDSFEANRVRGMIMQGCFFDNVSARPNFEAAYDLAPNVLYTGRDLALLELSDGNTQGAIDIFNEIVELNPTNGDALYNLGIIYIRYVGDSNQAADVLTQCVSANPDYIPCHYWLGRVQIDLEQYQLAADLLAMPIAQGTTNPTHYWWAAYSQVLLGNCPAAVPLLNDGYDLAFDQEMVAIYDDYDGLLRQCQSPGGVVLPTSTPEGFELTPTADPAGSGG